MSSWLPRPSRRTVNRGWGYVFWIFVAIVAFAFFRSNPGALVVLAVIAVVVGLRQRRLRGGRRKTGGGPSRYSDRR